VRGYPKQLRKFDLCDRTETAETAAKRCNPKKVIARLAVGTRTGNKEMTIERASAAGVF
jgi:hypothetical protein